MNEIAIKNRLFPSLIFVFSVSLIYWTYLAFATGMNISCDSIGYSELGRLLQHDGLVTYAKTGPQREPIYPLLISLAMHIESLSGIAYTKIMAGFGVIILGLSQILIWLLLQRLNVRTWICAAILLYFGFSPAILNTAFSLYSEIATYPFILGIIFASYSAITALKRHDQRALILSAGLMGLLFASVTLVKAVFEMVFPFFLMVILAILIFSSPKPRLQQALRVLTLGLIAAICYYAPILGYKQFNKIHNGHFAITNRGSWALYGNTARRMEPLTMKRFLTAAAYVPGEGVCTAIFSDEDCRFWSFYQSDTFGFEKLDELKNANLPAVEVDARLISMSKDLVLKNPPQYALLTFLEGLKMFFWESTQIGFAQYPAWLQKIYDNGLIKNAVRLGISTVTLICICLLVWNIRRVISSDLLMPMAVLILFYITFYAFFFILTRYALPIAPLYLVLIGYTLQTFWPQKR